MRAMVLGGRSATLAAAEVPAPRPDEHQVLVRVSACVVCRVDAQAPLRKSPPGAKTESVLTDYLVNLDHELPIPAADAEP
jgi:NADPH:quinone reductase-like Zn-dependent oxidoreductase